MIFSVSTDDVRPLQGRVVVVRLQEALAARRVGRRQLGPQFGIAHLAGQVTAGPAPPGAAASGCCG